MTSASVKRILLTGATGYVGGTILDHIVKSQDAVLKDPTFDRSEMPPPNFAVLMVIASTLFNGPGYMISTSSLISTRIMISSSTRGQVSKYMAQPQIAAAFTFLLYSRPLARLQQSPSQSSPDPKPQDPEPLRSWSCQRALSSQGSPSCPLFLGSTHGSLSRLSHVSHGLENVDKRVMPFE